MVRHTRIWKYTLNGRPSQAQSISMPLGSEVISVANQFDRLVMWAKVDPTQPVEVRRFVVVFTGWEFDLDETWKFIGTAVFDVGALVLHVFEEVMPNSP